MGFWQHLVESYERNADALNKNYPQSSTTISNSADNIAIVIIDDKGTFLDCDVIKKRPTGKKQSKNPLVNITVPASEESLKRTSTAILPYPIFEQFDYLVGLNGLRGWNKDYIRKFDKHCEKVRMYIEVLKKKEITASGKEKIILAKRKKRWMAYRNTVNKLDHCDKKQEAYLAQLKEFSESEYATEQIKAVYQYLMKKTIASDLSNLNPKPKTYILFQVEVAGASEVKMWENGKLFNAWSQYYLDKKTKVKKDRELSLDYLTGTIQPMAEFHPKKISNGAGNAKLISKPSDKSFYTYQGKFSDFSEAVSVGYESSQKAHQFLRYLIQDRGYSCGEQVILSYTIGSIESELPPPIEEKSIWNMIQTFIVKTQKDAEIELRAITGFDYADSLKKSLASYGSNIAHKDHAHTAVIALDAATTGRLSITFYRELKRGEYLEKIANWHNQCKWQQQLYDKKNEKIVFFIGAPSVDRIIEAVYGKPRGTKDESYTKIKKAARERLLRCIFDGADVPYDYVRAAIGRASTPLGITRNGKFNRHDFKIVLSTACALVRKDFQQRNQEIYEMSIEIDRTDRDYLYGRLLGAADKLEEYALYKKRNDRVVTAALRHMQAFAQRPFSTWSTIHGCLTPYIQQVKGSFGFSEIKEIKQQFERGDYEKNAPLGGAYLLGYYHELAHIEELVEKRSQNK